MKTLPYSIILFLIFFCAICFQCQAYETLRVGPAQSPWSGAQATIEEAFLSVRPQGTYIEYGLYLTISARDSWYDSPNEDNLEISMDFDLPENSFITDSWLWVGNDIMKALLIDRGNATNIYEGFIQRQTDPSILYKNSDQTYQLRVYPMMGNGQRKVKITYLVPAYWSRTRVSAPLPVDILRMSRTVPELRMEIHGTPQFQQPVINELGVLPNSPSVGGSIHLSTIPSYVIESYEGFNVSFSAAYSNGMFLSYFTPVYQEGYYQFVMHPRLVQNNVNVNNKLLVLIDHQNTGETSLEEVLGKTREMLREYMLPTDSFNIFFLSNTVNWLNAEYQPADLTTLNTSFASITSNWTSNGQKLDELVEHGINYVRNHGGQLLLLTDHCCQSSSVYTQFRSNIDAVQVPPIPINVVSYATQSSYYAGNLFSHLAASSGGEKIQHQWEYTSGNWSYARLQITRFDQLMRNFFFTLAENSGLYQVESRPSSGICYAEYDNQPTSIQSYRLNQPYVEIGKYFGGAPFQIDVNQVVGSSFQTNTYTVSNPVLTDSMNKKIWAAQYIRELEHLSPLSSIVRETIDSSKANRILSRYTAFLALEPNDTLPPCVDCDDESSGGLTSIDVTNNNSFEWAVNPNPFEDQVTFSISLGSNEELTESKIRIYNLNGQLVAEIEVPEFKNQIKITWNGAELETGIYLAVLETSSGKRHVKLVRQ